MARSPNERIISCVINWNQNRLKTIIKGFESHLVMIFACNQSINDGTRSNVGSPVAGSSGNQETAAAAVSNGATQNEYG